MKRVLLIFAVVFICLFAFWGCGKTPSDNDAETQPDTLGEESLTNADIKIMQHSWDGWGVSTKTIPASDITKSIIDELVKMTETGEIVAEVSEGTLDEYFDNYENSSLARGTMWLEVGSRIYRISPALTEICRVDTHLGEGRVLGITDKFKTLVRDVWQYYPYNYYKGKYIKSTGDMTLKRVFSADSTIEINIKKIEIEEGFAPENKITLGLVSTIDQIVEINLHCQQSDDNLAGGDRKEIALSMREEREIELGFGGWDNSNFRIYITADNTRLELEINTMANITYEYSDVTIGVKNGAESINPIQTFAWIREYKSDWDVVAYADGLGYRQLFDDENFYISTLPAIVATDELTVTAPENLSVGGGFDIYDIEGNPYKYDRTGLKSLHLLPAGEYIVSFFERTDSRDTDPSAKTYWWTQYDNVFRLIVPERTMGNTYHSLSFNETSSLIDGFDVNAKYRSGERVEIVLSTVTEQYYRLFVNGKEIPMLTSDLSWSVFAFFMPDGDAHVEIEVVFVDIPEAPI